MKKLLIGLIGLAMLTIGNNAQALYTVKAWVPDAYIVRGTTIHTQGLCQKSDTSDILPGQIKEREIGACTGVYVESDHLEYTLQQCAHGTAAYNQNLGGLGVGGTNVVVGGGGQAQGGNVQGYVNIPVGTSPSPSLPTVGTSTGSTIWFMLAVDQYDNNGNCVANPPAQWVRLGDAPF